jgi:16S rRNA (guanine966-N2)-methyltransferase
MADNGYVRVSAGCLKNQKIVFCLDKGLRSTLSHVKETMFDWLMHDIQGAVCLDLFAGSGSLGVEALSRGAKSVCFVDHNKRAVDNIRSFLQKAQIDLVKYQLYNQDFENFIEYTDIKYDIVFLDPPYNDYCVAELLYKLQKNGILSSTTLVVFEAKLVDLAKLKMSFNVLKIKKMKNLSYGMLKVKE